MTTDDALVQAARVLSHAVSQKLSPSDLESDQWDPKAEVIYKRLLKSYTDEILAASAIDKSIWLLRRLASIESRLMQLQASHLTSNAPKNNLLEPELALAINRSAKSFAPLLSLLVDDSTVQTGLYPVERLASGRKFRWIGPAPRATIYVPRVEEIVKVRLFVLYAYPKAILDKVKVSLDNGPWSSAIVGRENDGGFVLSFLPEPGDKRLLQTTRLDIDSVRAESPKAAGEADERFLSIALWKVELAPRDTGES